MGLHLGFLQTWENADKPRPSSLYLRLQIFREKWVYIRTLPLPELNRTTAALDHSGIGFRYRDSGFMHIWDALAQSEILFWYNRITGKYTCLPLNASGLVKMESAHPPSSPSSSIDSTCFWNIWLIQTVDDGITHETASQFNYWSLRILIQSCILHSIISRHPHIDILFGGNRFVSLWPVGPIRPRYTVDQFIRIGTYEIGYGIP